MQLDIPFARKVLEYAQHEAVDYKFDMSTWGYRFNVDEHTCGTAACIAGTAVLLDPDTKLLWFPGGSMAGAMVDGRHVEVVDRAMQLLGIDRWTAEELFYCDNDEALALLQSLIDEAEQDQAERCTPDR